MNTREVARGSNEHLSFVSVRKKGNIRAYRLYYLFTTTVWFLSPAEILADVSDAG
jgi:hypothetical protein